MDREGVGADVPCHADTAQRHGEEGSCPPDGPKTGCALPHRMPLSRGATQVAPARFFRDPADPRALANGPRGPPLRRRRPRVPATVRRRFGRPTAPLPRPADLPRLCATMRTATRAPRGRVEVLA